MKNFTLVLLTLIASPLVVVAAWVLSVCCVYMSFPPGALGIVVIVFTVAFLVCILTTSEKGAKFKALLTFKSDETECASEQTDKLSTEDSKIDLLKMVDGKKLTVDIDRQHSEIPNLVTICQVFLVALFLVTIFSSPSGERMGNIIVSSDKIYDKYGFVIADPEGDRYNIFMGDDGNQRVQYHDSQGGKIEVYDINGNRIK